MGRYLGIDRRYNIDLSTDLDLFVCSLGPRMWSVSIYDTPRLCSLKYKFFHLLVREWSISHA